MHEVIGVTHVRDNVAKPRMEEMSWCDKFTAYEDVTDETCMMRTGRKPISCRWRLINKRDSKPVEVRSRLVAREIEPTRTDSCFAGTPPLALVRYVIRRAATRTKTGNGRQLLVLDAKRVFRHPDALIGTYVKPPHLRETD